MLKRKIMLSVCIFTLLFCCAWILDSKGKRQSDIPTMPSDERTELLQINPVNYELNDEQIKPFRPREYIRISPVL